MDGLEESGLPLAFKQSSKAKSRKVIETDLEGWIKFQ